MTTEKRVMVPLGDIIALDFECPHCHTRCSFPLEKIDRLLYSCPNCGEKWIREPKHSKTELESDAAVLQALQRYLRESRRRDFDAVIRLEIKGEEETDQAGLS